MFLYFQNHHFLTALGFLLLRLQPKGFQSERLKPHLRFSNIGRKMSLFNAEWYLKVHKQTLFSATCSIFIWVFLDQFFFKMPESFMFLVNGFQEMKVDGFWSKVRAICLNGLLVTDCSKTKPHSAIILLLAHYCRNYNPFFNAMLRRVYSAAGHTHAQGHAGRVDIIEYGCHEPYPHASLLIKKIISVYRKINEQIHTYLLENYDLAPAKM